MTALEYLELKYPGLDTNDKSGIINGNFWTGIAKLMEDYKEQENKAEN